MHNRILCGKVQEDSVCDHAVRLVPVDARTSQDFPGQGRAGQGRAGQGRAGGSVTYQAAAKLSEESRPCKGSALGSSWQALKG